MCHLERVQQQVIQPRKVFEEQSVVDGGEQMHINLFVEMRRHWPVKSVSQMCHLQRLAEPANAQGVRLYDGCRASRKKFAECPEGKLSLAGRARNIGLRRHLAIAVEIVLRNRFFEPEDVLVLDL